MSQPPSSSAGVLYEIRWGDICPWLILVRSLRAALLIRVLLLAMLGVVLTEWGWDAIDRVCSDDPAQLQSLTDQPPTIVGDHSNGWAPTFQQLATGPLVEGWRWVSDPLLQATSGDPSWRRLLALALCGAWTIAIWAVFGGAIARIGALYLTRGEIIGPIAAIKSALPMWTATAGAPMIGLIGLATLTVPLMLDGVLIRLNLFALVVGLVWAIVLAWGLVVAVYLLLLLVGWPLMWATIAVERSDAFDGVSRCFAYAYQRPLRLAFYLLVATLLGLLGETFVDYLAAAAIETSQWGIVLGAGPSRAAELVAGMAASDSGLVSTAAASIQFWKSAFTAIAASFPLAYLWTATVGIYLLLRRDIDSTEMDEISLDSDEQQEPLPDIESDHLTDPPSVDASSEP